MAVRPFKAQLYRYVQAVVWYILIGIECSIRFLFTRQWSFGGTANGSRGVEYIDGQNDF